ncbi:unnamed protein product, partial [Meganyctiphanes norvegica]|uniref:Cilia- and flagella-associated protein 418 n=1 Tax=Meganyctiphanes norvegica TaxID=48144 RepID=A0AAV2SRN9_MEGNR
MGSDCVDDIDDLLNDAETFISSKNKTLESLTWEPRNSIALEDDLSDLLDDFEGPPEISRAPVVPGSMNLLGSQQTTTTVPNKEQCCCLPLYLGGSNILLGRSTGPSMARACDHIRCLSCDFIVVHIDGFAWRTNVDYLFLRNNFPDISKLRARLEPSRGKRAYACQCKYRSVDTLSTIDKQNDLNWVCAKHK